MIPKQIPAVFLEGYNIINKSINDAGWPKKPKFIFTSNALLHDDLIMAYTAKNVEYGTKLICGQHGGIYGIAKFSWAENHEIEISDKYLTWGWNYENYINFKLIPVGYFKEKFKNINSPQNTKLVIVCLEISRYTYRISSELMAMVNHTDNCVLFVNNLQPSIIN